VCSFLQSAAVAPEPPPPPLTRGQRVRVGLGGLIELGGEDDGEYSDLLHESNETRLEDLAGVGMLYASLGRLARLQARQVPPHHSNFIFRESVGLDITRFEACLSGVYVSERLSH